MRTRVQSVLADGTFTAVLQQNWPLGGVVGGVGPSIRNKSAFGSGFKGDLAFFFTLAQPTPQNR